MRGYRVILGAAALSVGACASDHDPVLDARPPATVQAGEMLTVATAERTVFLDVAGTAAPLRQATLSTKLLGSVTHVDVQEGDLVRQGQPLLRIDARDLTAKSAQLEAALAEAEAVHGEAELHARRMRALFDDDAAPRAQLDAAETGLVRARAGVDAVRASALELAAVREYSVVRAPFDGIVVSRMVDPGSFAAPGSPLLMIQDVTALRISATTAPEAVRGLTRGQQVTAVIEGDIVTATIEGVVPGGGGGVPGGGGGVYTVNAIVANPGGRLLAGGSATLALPQGVRSTHVVPRTAIVRQADMTGVYLMRDGGQLLRWVRIAPAGADSVEVLSGLRDGDVVIVPVGG